MGQPLSREKRISQTDARGITASYSYDALNRLTTITYPTASENVTLTYDTGSNCTAGVGRLCQRQDQGALVRYAYDVYGNLTRESRLQGGVTTHTLYSYDAGHRIKTLTYPDGRIVAYTRDAQGRISQVRTQVNGATQTVVSTRGYRPDGLLSQQTWGNTLLEIRQHDLQGRLTHQTLGSNTRDYTYDPNGNLTARQTPTESGAYSYDPLDRLSQDTHGAVSTAFGYDPNGNRLTQDATPYTYAPSSNQLTQVGTTPLTLDAAGNLLSDGSRSFSYNDAGRLSQVTQNTTPQGIYLYNAQGLRTVKYTPISVITFHYDTQGRLLEEFIRANGQDYLRAYVWADDQVLAQIVRFPNSGTPIERLTYLHTDHLDTPRLATDTQGTVVWRWEGAAFGTTAPDPDPDGNGKTLTINLRFPGQYYDAETGMHYNYFRDYDPTIGRYIQSDPIGLVGGLNTYTYVGNNPLRYTDPTGQFIPVIPSVIGGAAVGGGAAFLGTLAGGGSFGDALKASVGGALGGASLGLTASGVPGLAKTAAGIVFDLAINAGLNAQTVGGLLGGGGTTSGGGAGGGSGGGSAGPGGPGGGSACK